MMIGRTAVRRALWAHEGMAPMTPLADSRARPVRPRPDGRGHLGRPRRTEGFRRIRAAGLRLRRTPRCAGDADHRGGRPRRHPPDRPSPRRRRAAGGDDRQRLPAPSAVAAAAHCREPASSPSTTPPTAPSAWRGRRSPRGTDDDRHADGVAAATPSLMLRETAEAPDVVARLLDANAAGLRGPRRPPPPQAAGLCRDLRPGQLRQRRDLRQVPDRDLPRPGGGLGRALDQFDLRPPAEDARRAVRRHLAVGPQPRPADARRGGARRRCPDGRDRQRHDLAARRTLPGRPAAPCRSPRGASPRPSPISPRSPPSCSSSRPWSGDPALDRAVRRLPDDLDDALRRSWLAAVAGPRCGAEPLRGRPRAWLRRGAGGRAQVQGDRRPARRGAELRRASPWPAGARRSGLPGGAVQPERRGAPWTRRTRDGACRPWRAGDRRRSGVGAGRARAFRRPRASIPSPSRWR